MVPVDSFLQKLPQILQQVIIEKLVNSSLESMLILWGPCQALDHYVGLHPEVFSSS